MFGIVKIIIIVTLITIPVAYGVDAWLSKKYWNYWNEDRPTICKVFDGICSTAPIIGILVLGVCFLILVLGNPIDVPNDAQHISGQVWCLDGKAVTVHADPNQDKADAWWNGVHEILQEASPEEVLHAWANDKANSAAFELLKSTTRSCHAEEVVLKCLMDQPVGSLDANALLFMEECAAKCGVQLPNWGDIQAT